MTNDLADILAPNAEDEDGEYFDPWQALGLVCCGYNSAVDQQAIDVLRGIRDKLYSTDIAERTGLFPEHVELYQGIFSSANWCEYGTSPRGCWFVHDQGDGFGDRLIAAWEVYFERHWGEPPAASSQSRIPNAAALLAWFGEHRSLELYFYCPTYGDDDDQAREWRVSRQSGSINDREWTTIGRGETPIDAIASAERDWIDPR